MAHKEEPGELPTVADLLQRSQTKPLLIREDLDELLEAHPVKTEPPPEPARRVRPLWLALGAAAVLAGALFLFLPSADGGGTAVTPPRTPYTPPETSSEAVATISASAGPTTATAGIRQEPVKTTSAPPSTRKQPSAEPADPEETWRDLISSIVSSYQHSQGHHGPPR